MVPDEAQAHALVARARAGEDFAALARELSTAASRDAGGDLGVLHRGEMNAAVEAVAFALPEGGVSEPIPTEGGYRIIRVTEKKEGSVASFDEVKAEIVKRLSQERATLAYDAYLEGLRKNAVDPDHGHGGPAAGEPPRRGHGDDAAAVRRRHHRGPVDPDAEFVTTPQTRPERVAPPALPAGTAPAPAPSPSPGPPAR